jgi:hypothetical protein
MSSRGSNFCRHKKRTNGKINYSLPVRNRYAGTIFENKQLANGDRQLRSWNLI